MELAKIHNNIIQAQIAESLNIESSGTSAAQI
jgi:hypothetical protein